MTPRQDYGPVSMRMAEARPDPSGWPLAGASGPDVSTARRLVLHSDAFLLEDSSRDVLSPIGKGYAPYYQIAFPYFGAFDWRVGRERRLIDTNVILFVTPGQEFEEMHPHADIGHASAIITPANDLLEEVGVVTAGQPFPAISRPMTDAMRLATHRLLFADLSNLAKEEIIVELLARASVQRRRVCSSVTPPVVEKAKQLLHELGYEPLSLSAVARRLGVSPIYLTQTFTRAEGMPLYRYHMRLRLGRALLELPRRESLVELALDLGFSSHSHFSSMFRSVFGLTPSQFRAHCGWSAGVAKGRLAQHLRGSTRDH